MKLIIIGILLLIFVMLSKNIKEGYSISQIPDLIGTWQIPSTSRNNPRTIKLTQQNDKVSGSDYYCLGNGTGKIINNAKIIWMWGDRKNTKMIGDIILENVSDKPKAIEIKWQNGYSWNKILPADIVNGQWESQNLSHGPITINQKNNSISASYPVHGLFIGTVVNNKISITWQNGVKVNGIINKDTITWDTGIKWKRKPKIQNISNINDSKNRLNITSNINEQTNTLTIPPPHLELPKKHDTKKRDILFSSPLPTLESENLPYPELTTSI